MAKKQMKIKRYRKIYGGRSTASKVLGTLLTVVVLAGLAYLGWTLYDPVSAFLENPASVPETSQSEISQPEKDTASSSVELITIVPRFPATEITDPAQIKAAWLPHDLLLDETALKDKLKSLRKSGFNTVLIDAKDADGQVLYQTADRNALSMGVQAENAVDLAQLTDLAKEYRLSVMARIYAFKDHAAGLINTGWAVKYMDTEMLWLDNSKEKGGRSWLNPYSEEAQMYIAELAMECVDLGCEAILLDGVQFPEGLSLDLIGYGAQTVSRDEILAAFVQDMDELLQDEQAFLVCSSATSAMLGQRRSSHQSGSLTYSVKTLAPDMRPASFTGALPEGLTVTEPKDQPAETVAQCLRLLNENVTEKSFLPILQMKNADGSGYNGRQVKAQIEAAKAAGAQGYIVCSENGEYPIEE